MSRYRLIRYQNYNQYRFSDFIYILAHALNIMATEFQSMYSKSMALLSQSIQTEGDYVYQGESNYRLNLLFDDRE